MARNPDRVEQVSEALRAASAGDAAAMEQLWSLVYDELRSIAGHLFKAESPDHTLQPNAVVNEAYVRLFGGRPPSFRDLLAAPIAAAFLAAPRRLLGLFGLDDPIVLASASSCSPASAYRRCSCRSPWSTPAPCKAPATPAARCYYCWHSSPCRSGYARWLT